jgi:hypothetical protein
MHWIAIGITVVLGIGLLALVGGWLAYLLLRRDTWNNN